MRSLLLITGALLIMATACDRRENSNASANYVPVATQPTTNPGEWTPQRVEADPDGFLRWWDQQVAQCTEPLQRQIDELTQKRLQWDGAWQLLSENIGLVESLRNGLYRQYQLTQFAEPQPETVSVAGKTLPRSRVPKLLIKLDALAKEQQALRDLAQATSRAHDSRAALLEAHVQRFLRLRDRVRIDVGIVKETKSAIGLDVKETRQDLESESNAVPTSTSPDFTPLPATLPTTRPVTRLTFEELLS